MKTASNWLKASFLLACFLSTGSVYAATAGLPFTEDFSAQTLMDAGQTSANWSNAEQAVYLAWYSQRLHHLPDGTTPGTNLGNDTDATLSVTLGDVDGDGDLDLVAGNTGTNNKLYLNDGSGGVAASGTALGSETDSTYSVTLSDVDGDGDLDLVAGNFGTNKLYLNDGSGGLPPAAPTWAATPMPPSRSPWAMWTAMATST